MLICRRYRFDSWVRKIPWRRSWQPTPVSLPGKSQGQRSLVGYSSRSHKESDMTEQLNNRRMLLCIRDTCVLLWVLEKREPGIFCDLKRPFWGPGAHQTPWVSSLHVSWWKAGTRVGCSDSGTPGAVSEPGSPHIWLQPAPVCFRFCTQTTTLAASSGTARASAGPARRRGCGRLTWSRPRSTPFQLAFVSVSVSPLERVFRGNKHAFIIISPLLTPSPSAVNYVPAKEPLFSIGRPPNTHPYRTDPPGVDGCSKTSLRTELV